MRIRRHCGYESAQIENGLKRLVSAGVKQIGPDASHLYSMLLDKGLIESKNTPAEWRSHIPTS